MPNLTKTDARALAARQPAALEFQAGDLVGVKVLCPVCKATLSWPITAPGASRPAVENVARICRGQLANHLHADGCYPPGGRPKPPGGVYARFSRRHHPAAT